MNDVINYIQKWSSGDFIVNEIDSEGNVVRLTNFDIPIMPVKEEPIITEEDRSGIVS